MISVVVPVFRNAASALELVHSLRQQELPPDCPLEIIVVDDGSDDGSTDLLHQCENEQTHLVALLRNMGRSVARNIGAERAAGKFLAFIDCDCRPANQHFLAAHLQLLRDDCIAACGPVTGNGHGFWSHYQNDASSRRARQYAQGAAFAGSTQNFAVHAEVFMQSGGFDARYREYGFEDRDLFVRLSHFGKLGWCADAQVRHLDQLTLQAVLAKMHRAAGEPAALFSRDHAEAYKRLGYAVLDSRLHGWLRPVAALLNPILRLASTIDRLLVYPWLPYPVTKPIVKLFVALAYMHGTTGRSRAATTDRN